MPKKIKQKQKQKQKQTVKTTVKQTVRITQPVKRVYSRGKKSSESKPVYSGGPSVITIPYPQYLPQAPMTDTSFRIPISPPVNEVKERVKSTIPSVKSIETATVPVSIPAPLPEVKTKAGFFSEANELLGDLNKIIEDIPISKPFTPSVPSIASKIFTPTPEKAFRISEEEDFPDNISLMSEVSAPTMSQITAPTEVRTRNVGSGITDKTQSLFSRVSSQGTKMSIKDARQVIAIKEGVSLKEVERRYGKDKESRPIIKRVALDLIGGI